MDIGLVIIANEIIVLERAVLYKLKEVYNRIKKISINKTYTIEEINNLIQQIKVLDNQLIVTIVINGITFTEELHY